MIDQPEWRDIPGYEGRYQVSSDGQVKSLAFILAMPKGATRHYPEAILKPSPNSGGYLSVGLSRDGAQRTLTVHRLVARVFLGEKPFRGAQVLHGDGNQLNNNVANLRWGTGSENQLDSVRHGSHPEARRMQCVRNHVFDEANTRIEHVKRTGRTRRVCRACDRRKAALRRRSMRARAVAA